MRRWRLLGLIVVLASLPWLLNLVPWPQTNLPPLKGPSLAAAKSWGYQLQRVHSTLIPAPLDLLVVDYGRDDREQQGRTADDIEALRKRPDGSNRLVLAYMSVGEAENYRFYWRRHWQYRAPGWLSGENSDWKGNFHVRFWDPGWQRILMNPDRSLLDRILEIYLPSHKSYIDRVIEAGFDGVYLDRVDAFYDGAKEMPTAEAAMVTLVTRLSAYAKQRRPGFLVVPQNGEELLQHAPYRKVIDGIAKEDLILGVAGAEKENTADDINRSIELLNMAKADRLPVFVVEYAQAPDARTKVRQRVDSLGYVTHFARRDLNLPPELYRLSTTPAPGQSSTPKATPLR
jgi:cysteinyl-tRNA synthetase, unknown class